MILALRFLYVGLSALQSKVRLISNRKYSRNLPNTDARELQYRFALTSCYARGDTIQILFPDWTGPELVRLAL